MVYKSDDETRFWENWQALVDKTNAGYLYLPKSLDAQLLLLKDRSLMHADKSFIYFVNNKPAAGVFLPLEKHDGRLEVSLSGGYVMAPLVYDISVEKEIFKIIDDIALEHEVVMIKFAYDSLDEELTYNQLQKYGYFDTSILNYVVDLKEDKDLLKSCRKGHRSDIKRLLSDDDYSTFHIDLANPSYELHEEYRELHHKCSGKVTRLKEHFDTQFERLRDGNAVLFGLQYKNKNIAFSYFGVNNSKAIYASTADDPKYDKFPLYHILIYRAMEYFKEHGVLYIDMSQPSSPSQQFDYYPDDKQLNIAKFKRGFGGDYRMLYRGVKYFSQKAFEKDLHVFQKIYVQES